MKEKKTNWLKDHAGDILSFGGLVLCIILFTLLSKANGNDFWSAYNLKKLIEQVCVYAILAVGAVFIYSMGAMDISVGAQIGVYCITLILIANATGSLLAGFLAVLVLALLCGFFNGYVSVLLGLPSIVTSIFLMSIFSGVQMLLMEKIGSNTVKLISELKAIRNIFKDTSVMLAAIVVISLIAAYLYYFTALGRNVRSIGAEEWMDSYGMVYKRCIDAGALTVMAGYMMQPAWSRKLNPRLKDEEILPGALSKELLTGLLRGKLGFNGTIITDSTAMAGLGSAMSRKNALPTCINAGCDMILFARNMEEDLGFVRTAVETGVISQERLNEAVIRILALKAALKLPQKKAGGTLAANPERIAEIVGCKEHLDVSRDVADRSITLVKEEPGVLPLTPDRYPRLLVYPKEAGATDLAFGAESRTAAVVERLTAEGFQVDVYRPSKGFEGIEAPTTDVTDHYDALIYVANYATKSNQTVVRLEWAQPMGADCPMFLQDMPNIFISLENPYHLVDVPRMRTYINTYGATDEVLDELVAKLTGRSAFKGKSPVDAFCGMWDTHLM